MYTNIILTLILITLLFDLYQKNSSIIKKRFRKVEKAVTRKKDHFSIRKKGYGDKVAEDLKKDNY